MHIDSDRYESIHAMQHQISQHHLLKIVIASPILSEILMTKLASYVVLLLDWKVVRIMQIVYRILEAVSSCKIFNEFMPQKSYFLSNYIYSGPFDSIETRKNIVWCLSLASIRKVWLLINTLVDWSQTSDLWTSKVRCFCVYVDQVEISKWGLIVRRHPCIHQLDYMPNKRQSRISIIFRFKKLDSIKPRYFTIRKNCFTNKFQHVFFFMFLGKGLFHNLASLWRKLFCSNAIILSLFVISILNHLHVDQQISLVLLAFRLKL